MACSAVCYTKIVYCVSSRVVSSRYCLPNIQLYHVYHRCLIYLWFVFAYRVGDDHLRSAVFCLYCSQPLFMHTKEKANKASANSKRARGARGYGVGFARVAVFRTSKPPKTMKQDRWTTETKQGEYVISFTKGTFYFVARLYPVLNSHVPNGNGRRTPHSLGSHVPLYTCESINH